MSFSHEDDLYCCTHPFTLDSTHSCLIESLASVWERVCRNDDDSRERKTIDRDFLAGKHANSEQHEAKTQGKTIVIEKDFCILNAWRKITNRS